MDFLERARELFPQICKIREDLHMHPELGNHELWTSAYIESCLKGLGLEVTRYLETSVVARLHGARPGRTVAIRADMDALPVTERTSCPFTSATDGLMHACGHDIHMTGALICAKLLCETRESLSGDVLFIFQADEEGSGGAQRLIDAGALENVDAVFGCHVAPDLPLGTVGIRYGKFYAASDVFKVTVSGVSCHGATPEKGTNALLASCDMVSALSKIKGQSNDRFVLSVCQIESGNACNVIPGQATFGGILRTLGPENRQYMKGKMEQTVQEIAKQHNVECKLEIRTSYGGIVNTDNETRVLERSARELLGDHGVTILTEPTMTTEDFGCYVDGFSGSFFHIGCGCSEPLHSDHFLPQTETAIYSASVFAQTVTNCLS